MTEQNVAAAGATVDRTGTLSTQAEIDVARGLTMLIHAVAQNNYEKGWRPRREDMPMGHVTRNTGEVIALIHSEVTEAFEAYRNNEPTLWFEYDSPLGKTTAAGEFARQPMIAGEVLGKPQGIASELADVVIRVLDMAEEFDIPIIDAILYKHKYNQTRPYRHGGKQA